MYYFPKDAYIDIVFGQQDAVCINSDEITRLCNEWGV